MSAAAVSIDGVDAATPVLQGNPGESALERVRRTCQSAVEALSGTVQIHQAAIDAFAASLDAAKLDESPFKGYPLQFASRFEEVNFIALTQLLNIGSGFRAALHAATGRGAWDTILFGCMSMHLSSRRLDADYFCNVSLSDVESTFGIPLSVDKSVGDGPIKMSVAGPLRPLAEHIRFCLAEVGRVLHARSFASLGHMIYNVRSKYGGEAPRVPELPATTAAALVTRLASAFKPFNDVAVLEATGAEVCFYKKAQVLASQLYHRFKDEDAYFNFPDMSSLTVFADNVVPCMLRHFGALTVSDELAAAIAAGRAIGAADEIALRAAAVVVGDRIVAALKARGVATATAASVDYYLWTEAKVGELRALPRHANPLTYFY